MNWNLLTLESAYQEPSVGNWKCWLVFRMMSSSLAYATWPLGWLLSSWQLLLYVTVRNVRTSQENMFGLKGGSLESHMSSRLSCGSEQGTLWAKGCVLEYSLEFVCYDKFCHLLILVWCPRSMWLRGHCSFPFIFIKPISIYFNFIFWPCSKAFKKGTFR